VGVNWFTGIVVYIIVWWLVLFTILPWGNRPPDRPGRGHADGAPERPRLVLKTLVTTAIAAAVWGVIYWAMAAGLVSFRAPSP
jgi:predicted secreted protein